jgi:hypothetical protein
MVNREDVVPRWVGKVLHRLTPPHEPRVMDVAPKRAIDLTDPNPVPLKITPVGRAVGPKRYVVCVQCNGGWMSRLETRAERIMTDLILGGPIASGSVTLDGAALREVVVWMTKTTLVMDSSEDTPPAFDQQTRDTFCQRRPERIDDPILVPLERSRVWIGGYLPSYGDLTARYILKLKRSEPNGSLHDTIVLATLVLGHLVLQFTATVLPDGSLGYPQRRPMPNEFVTELWPAVSTGTWPPGRLLDSTTLEAFALPENARPAAPDAATEPHRRQPLLESRRLD